MTQILKEGHWATSIDLTDAYLHIPIHVKSRKFLRFAFQGTVYQFTVLPFGLSSAPYVFTRMATQLGNFVQKSDISLTHTWTTG